MKELQPRTQGIFPTSWADDVIDDVTSEIAEDDWERGWRILLMLCCILLYAVSFCMLY